VIIINYAVLIVMFIAFIFYYLVRFYLNKYKNFKLPLVMERYHDNPYLTFIQAIIIIIGIIIGYSITVYLF